jgi:glycine cleavage system aminomethyltransferase T
LKSDDFIGKAAYLKAREDAETSGPAAIMCTLSMDSQVSAAGTKRYPTGGNEPIVTLDGNRIVDSHGRPSRVTTAGAAPSLGKYLLLAYLPPERAVEGNKLGVVYMNEQYPVTVDRVGSQPLFDPNDDRMKTNPA